MAPVAVAVAMAMPVTVTVAMPVTVAMAMPVTMAMPVAAAVTMHFDRLGRSWLKGCRGGSRGQGLCGERGGLGGLAAGDCGSRNTTDQRGEESATIQHGNLSL